MTDTSLAQLLLHLVLLLLVAGPPTFILWLSALPGIGLAGPPRRLFYRVHRSRWLGLPVAVLALGALALRGWLGLADPWWPLVGGAILAVVLTLYLLFLPVHLFQTLHRPRYEAAADARCPEDMLVMGLDRDGPPRAYSLDTLIQPHGVVDSLGRDRVLLIWCSLSSTASALKPGSEVSDLESFRPATAINDNICFYDHGNGNLFQQIEDEVVCGPDAGHRSDVRPVTVTTWRMWKRLHPDSLLCHMPPARLRDRVARRAMLGIHHRLPTLDEPLHPIDRPLDERLPVMAPVLALSLDGEDRAWARELLQQRQVVSTEVAGEPLVLLADRDGEMAAAYRRSLLGEVLDFEPLGATEAPAGIAEVDPRTIVARSTDGSLWDLAGRCVAGSRRGARLASPHHFQSAFWFAWARAHPDTEVVGDAQESSSSTEYAKSATSLAPPPVS